MTRCSWARCCRWIPLIAPGLPLELPSDFMYAAALMQIIGSLFALYSINVSAGLVRERMMDLAQVGK